MGTRFTSHRNPDTGKYDVLKVVDGEDGSPNTGETTVIGSFETSPEANAKVEEMLKEQTTDAEEIYSGARTVQQSSMEATRKADVKRAEQRKSEGTTHSTTRKVGE